MQAWLGQDVEECNGFLILCCSDIKTQGCSDLAHNFTGAVTLPNFQKELMCEITSTFREYFNKR